MRDYLKRQKIFNSEDHQYLLKAEIKKNKAPLISSILDVLRQALEYIILQLKQSYKPGIYICLFLHQILFSKNSLIIKKIKIRQHVFRIGELQSNFHSGKNIIILISWWTIHFLIQFVIVGIQTNPGTTVFSVICL